MKGRKATIDIDLVLEVREMRRAGLTWKSIERETGYTRQGIKKAMNRLFREGKLLFY